MKEKLKVSNGTRKVMFEEIDLDEYDTPVPTNADDINWRKAFRLLEATMDDVTFADDGHRNDDAVNACIALHIMGYNAETWFNNWCDEQFSNIDRWYQDDLSKFMEHVERVAPYLSSWGPVGNETNAFRFAL